MKTDENELTGVKDIFDQEAHSRAHGKVSHPKKVSNFFPSIFYKCFDENTPQKMSQKCKSLAGKYLENNDRMVEGESSLIEYI